MYYLSDVVNGQEIFKMMLSPTRTYAPVIRQVLSSVARSDLHGAIHNTGGGQTKVLNFLPSVGIHVIKNDMFGTPEIFKLVHNRHRAKVCDIKKSNTEKWYEMYKTFNMGHRIELYLSSVASAVEVINIASTFNIEAKIVGRVESCLDKVDRKSRVSIHCPNTGDVYQYFI